MTEEITVHRGDLFTSTAPALGHGVNVHGKMGKGIATLFRARHPEMYAAYRAECLSGDLQPGGVFPWAAGDGQWVYNLATQDLPGPHARLEWVEQALSAALTHADAHDVERVAIPQVGCGIGGLRWVDARLVVAAVQSRHWANVEVWALH